MIRTADYLNALIRDKNEYRNVLINYNGNEIPTTITFTELNEELQKSMVSELYSNLSFMNYPGTILPSTDIEILSICNFPTLSHMFYGCENLTGELNLSSWNKMKNITNMSNIFSNCNALTSLNLSNWDTSKVTNMACLFYACSNLTSVSLTNWNTSSATTMYNMFFNCSRLVNIDVTNFNTDNVSNFISIFNYCSNIKELNLSQWNVSKASNLAFMFYRCYNLTTVNLANWNPNNATSMLYMFLECNNLSNDSLKNICNMCIKAVNMHYKNLNNSNYYSPLYRTNKVINIDSVGQDILNNLTSAGWTY